jgi:hypothetical protein
VSSEGSGTEVIGAEDSVVESDASISEVVSVYVGEVSSVDNTGGGLIW